MEGLRRRSAQDVLDDHLGISSRSGPDEDIERLVEEDLRRNVDAHVRVADGADSYLIEDGNIVAQTIHYPIEPKDQAR